MYKSILAVILGSALIVGCAEKADAGETYVSGGMGITSYDVSGGTDDQNGTNAFVNVGHIFDNNLGVEAEYEHIWDADIASDVRTDGQNTYTLYGVGRVPLDNEDKVNLVVKAGFGYQTLDVKTSRGTDSSNSWYPALGVGGEYNINDSWVALVTVDYKMYDFDDSGDSISTNPITYKAGVQYRF